MSDLTAADYDQALADHRRLVRELDLAMNGPEAAAQPASLCGLIEPARRMRSALIDAGTILNAIRARDGTACDFAEDYFNAVVERITELLGGDILRAQWSRDHSKPKVNHGESV
jgi:hypothetical protein